MNHNYYPSLKLIIIYVHVIHSPDDSVMAITPT